jgi:hypothetical protein
MRSWGVMDLFLTVPYDSMGAETAGGLGSWQ